MIASSSYATNLKRKKGLSVDDERKAKKPINIVHGSDAQWWQKGPIYHCYPKSFMDKNGDGIGDLKGIESKLDHFQDLGVAAVWLSPIYESPMKDNGYDVKNFKAIDPVFGTIEDFKSLAHGMKDRGIKLIMDFIPNHTSDQHEWFQRSIAKEGKYKDYYVWLDGKQDAPPNNWVSVFGGPAWTWHASRGQWYLHQFYKEQPDLNLRNDDVVNEMIDTIKFWMELGVSGFRIDAVAHFFEDESFSDEPLNLEAGDVKPNDYGYLEHKYTFNQPENIGLIQKFRYVLDEKTAEDSRNPRIMLTEAYLPLDELIKYYGSTEKDPSGTISQMPLNFGLITDFKDPSQVTAERMRLTLETYLEGLPSNAWPNFNMGNHDNPRAGSRFGERLIDAMNMILLLLPGTPITYYGEEIGMVDGELKDPVDPRDPERTPMQWDDTPNAGFSTSTPWLPVNKEYKTQNVKVQRKAKNSHYQVWKKLAHLRREEAILFGSIQFATVNDVFAFSRIREGKGYIVVVNFGDKDEDQLNLGTELPDLKDDASVIIRSVREGQSVENQRINLSSLRLRSKESLVATVNEKVNGPPRKITRRSRVD